MVFPCRLKFNQGPFQSKLHRFTCGVAPRNIDLPLICHGSLLGGECEARRCYISSDAPVATPEVGGNSDPTDKWFAPTVDIHRSLHGADSLGISQVFRLRLKGGPDDGERETGDNFHGFLLG